MLLRAYRRPPGDSCRRGSNRLRGRHDSLGPHLAAIHYAATFLAEELRQRDPAAAAKVGQIGGMAGKAVTIARDLARGIFPVQLECLGLALVLEEYISKDQSPEEVANAIRTVVDGGIHASRELEVFALIGEGMDSREISARLHLVATTVDNYRARIKQKLALKNAAELYQRAAPGA